MASVKVAVRVRPFNDREINMDAKCIIKMESNKTIILNTKTNDIAIQNIPDSTASNANATLPTIPNISTSTSNFASREKFKEFIYDASYWSFDSNDEHYVAQLDVYNDLGKTTVNNAFEGYNACVCAYGQTGSGKSYSMMGMHNNSEQEGLIPRICKALFERIQNNSNQSVGYRTEVSYLEIYNEKVRDLLRTSQKTQQNLKVREHPKTGVYVQDLSQHIVVNYYDVEELINRGNINRTTASTNMNDVSSRSHAIFTIKFAQAKIVENIPSETISKMNLVDLAGSERADSTGATGIRLKEGGNINKSLLTFINVISTLADLSSSSSEQQKKTYIPYRDSVLTWLLKDSLGGNSKTVILAAISPADVNYMETLSTLRYANRAKNIINKPTINEDPNVKLIRELRAEIVRLKLLLQGTSIDSNLINEKRFSITNIGVDQCEIDIEKSEIELKQKIDYNETKVNELTNVWKFKWQKYHDLFDEYENLSIEKSDTNGLYLHTSDQPYLISINEMPSSMTSNKKKSKYQNGIHIYPLKEGKNYIGPKDSFYNGDLYGDESYKIDIYIENDDGELSKCYITRSDDGFVWLSLICGRVQLNNMLMNISDPVIELKNGDFMLVGDLNLFKFCNPIELPSAAVANEDFKLKNKKMFKDLFRLFLNGTNSVVEEEVDGQSEIACLNEKLTKYEKLIEDQREQIKQMNEQIEINNSEMKRLKELSIKLSPAGEPVPISPLEIKSKSEDISILGTADVEIQHELFKAELDERETMQNLIEKFERDEKLLSECMKELNKSQESQLKSLIFELQRLRLKEQELETEAKKSKTEIEKSMEKLNEKRDMKLSELNKMREQILQNKQMIDLKLNMSQLSHDEVEVDEKITLIKQEVQTEIEDLERLNNELNVKKMYSSNDNQTLDEIAEAEYETIKRSRDQLDKVKEQKEKSYKIIENELEQARKLMLNEFESVNPDLNSMKNEIKEIGYKEAKLKQFLNECLYENDEEKCLIENELTELVETRESFEEKCEDLRASNRKLVDEQMRVEYNGLDDIKNQDLEEIKQDEERIVLLEESSIKFLQNSIRAKKNAINDKQNNLKNLENIAEGQSKKMNKLLAELEVLESKRLFEESKIFNKELQVANEIKLEFDKLNSQMSKMDSFYHRKIDENLIKKENIKPKICALVGSHRGIQLFEADFNPKISHHNTVYANNELCKSNTSLGSNCNIEEYLSGQLKNKQISSLFVDTTFNDSGTNSGINSSASSNGVSPVSELVRTLRKEQQPPKFETSLCKYLKLSIEINESMLFGKKSWDEHYEYLIEIRICDESWFVFRRYSKIRQLHEQMCLLYPSLNRLVFPMRWLFNSADKHLIERQIQLEHYLKCFFEILLNDPTSPIYFNVSTHAEINGKNAQLSNSLSLNSISSSISNQVSLSSSLNINEIQTHLTRAKITSFCSFFEQTSGDLSYLNKLSINKLTSYKNMLNNEIV